MEQELHAKKLWLIDLQIQREEQKLQQDDLEHKCRMELIRKQIVNIGREQDYRISLD